jgi:hypothetical protein
VLTRTIIPQQPMQPRPWKRQESASHTTFDLV